VDRVLAGPPTPLRTVVPLRGGHWAVTWAAPRRAELLDTAGARIGDADLGPPSGPPTRAVVRRVAGDSFVVAPFIGANGVAVFTPAGAKSREVRWSGTLLPGRSARAFFFHEMFGDGALLVADQLISTGVTSPGFRRDSVTLVRLAPAGTDPQPFADLPAIDISPNGYPPTFGARFSHALHQDHYYHGLGDQFSIAVYRAVGTLARIVRRPWTARPPLPEEIERARTVVRRVVEHGHYDGPAAARDDSAARRRQGEQAAAALIFAPLMPAFAQVLVDPSGHLWVRHYSAAAALHRSYLEFAPSPPAAQWSVFAPDGQWLGELATPAGLDVRHVGDTHVTGVWRSPGGITHLRAHPIRKPS
jgi:hypothetical protein